MCKNSKITDKQSGNALIYVLIAIALFAALGFSMSRQTGDSNTKEIDEAKADLYALELMTYSVQAKSVLDQMIFTGTDIDALVFTKPDESGFNTAPHIHKVFHPQGGGLIPANIPSQAVNEISTPPDAGWYIGRFNNVEWTKGTGTDVIVTAHQIARSVCEELNIAIKDDATIPALTGDLEDYLIDTSTDNDLTDTVCAACEGYMSLCVSDNAGTTYSYYSVVAER